MAKRWTQTCSVSGCRKTAVTNFCTPISGLKVVWWACDGCSKAYIKNLRAKPASKVSE